MTYLTLIQLISTIIIVLASIIGNTILKKHNIEVSKELPRIEEIGAVVKKGIKEGVNIENILFPNSEVTEATKEISNIVINSINSIDSELLKSNSTKSIEALQAGINTEIKKRIAKG